MYQTLPCIGYSSLFCPPLTDNSYFERLNHLIPIRESTLQLKDGGNVEFTSPSIYLNQLSSSSLSSENIRINCSLTSSIVNRISRCSLYQTRPISHELTMNTVSNHVWAMNSNLKSPWNPDPNQTKEWNISINGYQPYQDETIYTPQIPFKTKEQLKDHPQLKSFPEELLYIFHPDRNPLLPIFDLAHQTGKPDLFLIYIFIVCLQCYMCKRQRFMQVNNTHPGFRESHSPFLFIVYPRYDFKSIGQTERILLDQEYRGLNDQTIQDVTLTRFFLYVVKHIRRNRDASMFLTPKMVTKFIDHQLTRLTHCTMMTSKFVYMLVKNQWSIMSEGIANMAMEINLKQTKSRSVHPIRYSPSPTNYLVRILAISTTKVGREYVQFIPVFMTHCYFSPNAPIIQYDQNTTYPDLFAQLAVYCDANTCTDTLKEIARIFKSTSNRVEEAMSAYYCSNSRLLERIPYTYIVTGDVIFCSPMLLLDSSICNAIRCDNPIPSRLRGLIDHLTHNHWIGSDSHIGRLSINQIANYLNSDSTGSLFDANSVLIQSETKLSGNWKPFQVPWTRQFGQTKKYYINEDKLKVTPLSFDYVMLYLWIAFEIHATVEYSIYLDYYFALIATKSERQGLKYAYSRTSLSNRSSISLFRAQLLESFSSIVDILHRKFTPIEMSQEWTQLFHTARRDWDYIHDPVIDRSLITPDMLLSAMKTSFDYLWEDPTLDIEIKSWLSLESHHSSLIWRIPPNLLGDVTLTPRGKSNQIVMEKKKFLDRCIVNLNDGLLKLNVLWRMLFPVGVLRYDDGLHWSEKLIQPTPMTQCRSTVSLFRRMLMKDEFLKELEFMRFTSVSSTNNIVKITQQENSQRFASAMLLLLPLMEKGSQESSEKLDKVKLNLEALVEDKVFANYTQSYRQPVQEARRICTQLLKLQLHHGRHLSVKTIEEVTKILACTNISREDVKKLFKELLVYLESVDTIVKLAMEHTWTSHPEVHSELSRWYPQSRPMPPLFLCSSCNPTPEALTMGLKRKTENLADNISILTNGASTYKRNK